MQVRYNIRMKNETTALDEADRKLLRALQRDAAISQAELADQAGVSASLVSRRIARWSLTLLKLRPTTSRQRAMGSVAND